MTLTQYLVAGLFSGCGVLAIVDGTAWPLAVALVAMVSLMLTKDEA